MNRVFAFSKSYVRDYFLILIGAFLQALAYVVFIAPYKIVPGGVYGISIVLHHVTRGLFSFLPEGLPIGLTALFFNVPLLFLAIKKLGLSSGPKTVVTFLLISIFTDALSMITSNEPLVYNEAILSCFYGGVILGIGVNLIFRSGSTSAGTDVLARVLAKNTNIKLGNLIIIIDSCIVLLGLLAFGDWAIPLYSWLVIIIFGQIVSLLQPENPNKALFIVSQQSQEISKKLIDTYQIYGTFLQGKGIYQGNDYQVIFVIVERKDLLKVKRLIRSVDEKAFISTMDANKDNIPPLA